MQKSVHSKKKEEKTEKKSFTNVKVKKKVSIIIVIPAFDVEEFAFTSPCYLKSI